jgi:hypothetical protein
VSRPIMDSCTDDYQGGTDGQWSYVRWKDNPAFGAFFLRLISAYHPQATMLAIASKPHVESS